MNYPPGVTWRDIPGNRPEDELQEKAAEAVGEEMNELCSDNVESCDWALFLSNDENREHPCGCFYDIVVIEKPLDEMPTFKVSRGDPTSCPFYDDAVEKRAESMRDDGPEYEPD